MVQCDCSLDADLCSCIIALHIVLQQFIIINIIIIIIAINHHHPFLGTLPKKVNLQVSLKWKHMRSANFYLAKFEKLACCSTA